MKKSTHKLFVVRKYVRARDVAEAVRLEKKQKPDDVWIDDEWKKGRANELASAIGFNVEDPRDDE